MQKLTELDANILTEMFIGKKRVNIEALSLKYPGQSLATIFLGPSPYEQRN